MLRVMLAFSQRKMLIGGNKPQIVARLRQTLRNGQRRIREQTCAAWTRLVVGGLHAKMQTEIGLRIKIDQQSAQATGGEGRAKIHGGGGFSNATFLIEQRDHAHFFLTVHSTSIENHGDGISR